MFCFETQKNEEEIREIFERIDELISDLRLEYLDLARKYDEAMERVEDLEADRLYQMDL